MAMSRELRKENTSACPGRWERRGRTYPGSWAGTQGMTEARCEDLRMENLMEKKLQVWRCGT